MKIRLSPSQLVASTALTAGSLSSASQVARAQDPFADAMADPCADLSEAICTGANTTFLTMCAGYVVSALVLCVPWTIVWGSRGARSMAMKRFIPLLVAALLAGLAVGFDPFASQNYVCCATDPTFAAVLLLGESPVVRALVLGALPTVAMYTVSVLVIQQIRNR